MTVNRNGSIKPPEAIIYKYFAVKKKALTLLELIFNFNTAGKKGPSLNTEERKVNLYYNPDHIVIGPVTCTETQRIYTTPLIVPEEHPYFFDHPLDHIPGILLLEGILQLFFIAAPDWLYLLKDQEIYIKNVEISFHHWCEKDRPIMVELTRKDVESSLQSRFAAQGRVIQNGKCICTVDLEGAVAAASNVPLSSIFPPESHLPYPELKLLHKRHKKNVFMSTLRPDGAGGYSCDLIKPAANHIFSNRKSSFYSMLYLLEAIRQFVMLLAHTIGKMPLEVPIILLSFQFSLHGPVYRQTNLYLKAASHSEINLGKKIVGSMAITLHEPGGILGEGSLKSMVISQEEYQRQRSII